MGRSGIVGTYLESARAFYGNKQSVGGTDDWCAIVSGGAGGRIDLEAPPERIDMLGGSTIGAGMLRIPGKSGGLAKARPNAGRKDRENFTHLIAFHEKVRQKNHRR